MDKSQNAPEKSAMRPQKFTPIDSSRVGSVSFKWWKLSQAWNATMSADQSGKAELRVKKEATDWQICEESRTEVHPS